MGTVTRACKLNWPAKRNNHFGDHGAAFGKKSMTEPQRPIVGSDDLKAILDQEDRELRESLHGGISKSQRSEYYCGPATPDVTSENDFDSGLLADHLQARFKHLPREAILAEIGHAILRIYMR